MLRHIRNLINFISLCVFCWLGIANASAALHFSTKHNVPIVERFNKSHKINAIANNDPTVGALKGNFQVTPTGTAAYSIPIAVSPGTGDIAPLLSIVYNSEQEGPMGNGLLGTGFSLQGLTAISRCPSNLAKNGHIHGVDYTDQDLFCFNGEQLVAVKGAYGQDGTEYRTFVSSNTKIVSYGRQGNGPASFKIWTKGGQVAEYASTSDSQIHAEGKNTVAVWALHKITDSAGNYLDIHYAKDEGKGEFYPIWIDYTGNAKAGLDPYNSVKFIYEGRPDPHTWYQAGSKNTIDRRLHEIQVLSGTSLLYDYHFNYEISPNTFRSRLSSIQQCDGSGVCLRPTTFSWQTNEMGWESAPQFTPPTPIVDGDGKDLGARFMDVSGTGLSSLVQNTNDHVGAWRNTGSGWENDTPYILPAPVAYDGDTGMRFVSMTGNGLSDILLNNNHAWKNTGSGWQDTSQYTSPTSFLNVFYKDSGARVVDLDGKGLPGIIKFGGAWISNGNGWQNVPQYNSPIAFVSDDGVDQGARIVGLTNDGLDGIIQNNGNSAGAWINNGSRWQSVLQYIPPHALILPVFSWDHKDSKGKIEGIDLGARFIDLNGSGLSGVVQNNAGDVSNNGAWINTGAGWLTAPQYNLPYPIVYAVETDGQNNLYMINDLGARFADFSGSGLAGIIGSNEVTSGPAYSGAWINNGLTWQNIPAYNPPCKFVRTDLNFPMGDKIPVFGKSVDLGVRLVDLEGYGLPSIVQNNGTNKGAWLNKAKKKPDYLIGVTDGLGGQLKIDYETLSSKKVAVYTKEASAQYPNMDWQGPMYVVYQTASDMGVTDSLTKNRVLSKNAKNSFGDNALLHVTTYHYTGAKFNHLGYGFLGFHKVTTKDESTGINVTTTYSQDYNQHTVGKVLNSETRLASGVLIASTQNIWDMKIFGDGVSTYYSPYTKTTITKSFDLNGNPINTKATDINVDAFTNPVTIVSSVQNLNGNETYTTTTNNIYKNDVNDWRIGELQSTAVTNSAPNTNDVTRHSTYGYDDTTGLLINTTVEPNNPQYCVSTDYTRDVFGNITSTKVSGLNDSFTARTSSSVYESTGRFIIKSVNALNQTTTVTYDARFGEILTATDLNNLTITNHYDSFGHLFQTDYPDNTSQTTSYNWVSGPNNAVYTVTTQKTGSPIKTGYFDQANRRVAETSQGLDGRIIWLMTYYDELSRVTARTLPYYGGGTPLYIRFDYDVLGRATKVTHPDGTATINRYDGITIVNKNALLQANVKASNIRDNVTSVIDNGTGETQYFYNAVGNLVKTIDSEGNVTTMTYDLYGHRIAIDDLDKGNWTYQYNPLGELITQTDAMGRKTSFQYDLLGRMISRTDSAATSNWEYDTAPHGVGKLAKVNGIANAKNDANAIIKAARENLADYSRTYVYDELGRPTQTITTVNGQNYSLNTSYDNLSRPLTTTYPSGLQTQNYYNDLGYLVKLDNAKTHELYWQLNSTNAFGQITSETNSNGLITNYTYDPKTGFLTDIVTNLNTALAVQKKFFPSQTANHISEKHVYNNSFKNKTLQGEMQNLHYSYDVIGNMTKRVDNVNAVTENFSYDEQNRLSQNSIDGGETTTYRYNKIGNITNKSDVGEYFYGGKGAGPHALTSTIAGHTRVVFQYNKNGDQISGTVHGVHRTISYTGFSKPKTINQGNATTNFYYNADRDEFMRTDVNVVKGVTTLATTLYLGNYEITSESDGQKVTAVRQKHYIGNNTLVILSDDGKNGTYVLLKDNLGSVTDIVDSNSNVVQHFTYTPFGEQRQTKGDTPAFPITHSGFTGHEELEPFNLVHMGGRLYDPVLGRFLSADPTVQAPNDPQDLNRYSYCVNNPLRFTDPSGFGIFDWVSDIISDICDIISDVVNVICDVICDVVRTVCDVVSSICSSKFIGTILELAVAAIATACSAGTLTMAYIMAATSAAVTAASGGSFADVLFAAGLAFVSVEAWGQVGDFCKPLKAAGGWGSNFAGNAESCVVHGAVGGTLNVIEGGSFKDGFLSAAVGDACSGMVNSIEKDSMSQTAIMERAAAAGVVGGTVAVITGGNFLDGAKTAAFAQMFNGEAHKTMLELMQQKMQQVRQWCGAHQTGLMVAANVVGLVAAPFTAGVSEEAALEVDEAMAVEEVAASTPVGRLGASMDVAPGINSPAEIDGIQYSGHALDQMQGRGLTPSIVQDALENGEISAGRDGTTIYRSGQVKAIVNSSGKVITAYPFFP